MLDTGRNICQLGKLSENKSYYLKQQTDLSKLILERDALDEKPKNVLDQVL